MIKRVLPALALFAALVGTIVALQTPTPAKTSGYPIRYTGWRAGFKTDGVRDNVFASRLRVRPGTRTVYSVENGRRTGSSLVSVAVVTNVSNRSLYYLAYGEGGPDYPTNAFDYHDELRKGVWVPTSACFCGTGLDLYALEPGQSVMFHSNLSVRAKHTKSRTRQWTVFSDRPMTRLLPNYSVDSLTLLADSGAQ